MKLQCLFAKRLPSHPEAFIYKYWNLASTPVPSIMVSYPQNLGEPRHGCLFSQWRNFSPYLFCSGKGDLPLHLSYSVRTLGHVSGHRNMGLFPGFRFWPWRCPSSRKKFWAFKTNKTPSESDIKDPFKKLPFCSISWCFSGARKDINLFRKNCILPACLPQLCLAGFTLPESFRHILLTFPVLRLSVGFYGFLLPISPAGSQSLFQEQVAVILHLLKTSQHPQWTTYTVVSMDLFHGIQVYKMIYLSG